MTAHLQAIVESKDHLINRLQQPFVGDSLKVEATYHRHVKELFPLAATSLAELNGNLETVQWASDFNMKDGRMVSQLTKFVHYYATLLYLFYNNLFSGI